MDRDYLIILMDNVTSKKRSWIMAQIQSTGNISTEQKLIFFFRRSKINGWRRNFTLPGKPDFVFPKQRLAIFVDGCFWHGCPKCCRIPQTNTEYWTSKIERNKSRDKTIVKILANKGWKVKRIWEHELKSDSKMHKSLRTIQKLLSILPQN